MRSLGVPIWKMKAISLRITAQIMPTACIVCKSNAAFPLFLSFWKGVHRHMERGISCPARWHHFSVWTKCFRWERWHVYHRVSNYFYQAQQCQRDSRAVPTQSSAFILNCPLLLTVAVLFINASLVNDGSLLFWQTPGSQLHDKQAAEGCSFFRPVEWTLHGHTQSFWICFGQYTVKDIPFLHLQSLFTVFIWYFLPIPSI